MAVDNEGFSLAPREAMFKSKEDAEIKAKKATMFFSWTTYERLKEDGLRSIFTQAFYSTFMAIDDDSNQKIFWDKNNHSLKLSNLLSVFTGYSPEDAEKERSKIFVFGLRVFRTVENLLKLVTEFPIKLLSYTFEKAYAHVLDATKPLMNYAEDEKNNVLLRAIAELSALILRAPIFVPFAALKITEVFTRLVVSPLKVWREADLADKKIDKDRALGPRGIAARVASVAAITAFCVIFPPFAAKVAPLIASSAGNSTVLGAIASVMASIGSGIGWVASTVTQGAAAGIYVGLTTGALITGFSFVRDLSSKIFSKKMTDVDKMAERHSDLSSLGSDSYKPSSNSKGQRYDLILEQEKKLGKPADEMSNSYDSSSSASEKNGEEKNVSVIDVNGAEPKVGGSFSYVPENKSNVTPKKGGDYFASVRALRSPVSLNGYNAAQGEEANRREKTVSCSAQRQPSSSF